MHHFYMDLQNCLLMKCIIQKENTELNYMLNVFLLWRACKDLLPEYFRFFNGVVDSEDLPLNVSRETLQHNPMITKIRKGIGKQKFFSKLKEIANKDAEKYKTFYKEFGPILKEGLHSDFENKDKLPELVRFQSSLMVLVKMILPL